jgi:multidrug efflux pump subunit AcrB
LSEHAFQVLVNAYARSLDVVLRHPLATLLTFFTTLAATVWLLFTIPKGFFPIQDTGLLIGQTRVAPEVSPTEMAKRTQALAEVIGKDRDVAQVAAIIGGARPSNEGLLFASLKPATERHASATAIVDLLRSELAKVQGATLILQPAQDINVGGRQASGLFQYTLQDSDATDLGTWSTRLFDKLLASPRSKSA